MRQQLKPVREGGWFRLDCAFAGVWAHALGKGPVRPHKRKDKIMILKVSVGFAALSDTEVESFAEGVIAGMTGNAAYPTPPVTLANLQAGADDFTAKIVVARSGGPV